MYEIRSESGLQKKFGSRALAVSDGKRLRKCQIAKLDETYTRENKTPRASSHASTVEI